MPSPYVYAYVKDKQKRLSYNILYVYVGIYEGSKIQRHKAIAL